MFARTYFGGRYFAPRMNAMGWSQGTAVANSWWPSGASGPPYMRLWASAADGTGIEEYPLETYHWHGLKVSRGYLRDGPQRMEFKMACAQHLTPIANRAKIWLVDESYGYWGTPVFEGHVDGILPASSLEIQYTCYSADKRAAAEASVMSVPYTGTPSAPTEGTGAVPALIFNCKEENDEEYAWSVDNDATIGTIIARILDDSKPLLASMLAAPPGATLPYVAGDLTNLVFKPQTKLAFTNETVAAAVDRTLQLDPRFRCLLVPGDNERQWRIYDVTASADTTLTLNDYSTKFLLSLNLNISTDRRFSAVKIYGPRNAVTTDFKTSDSTLTQSWDAGEETAFETLGPSGAGVANAGRVWQIANANRRNLASRLPSDALVPWDNGAGLIQLKTRVPTFVATFDAGDTWETVKGAVIDNRLGTVTVPNAVYRFTDGASPEYALPDNVWLLAAYYDTPLSVRSPSSGYAGTMYTTYGQQAENKIFDPGLAVGWENGTPVASATRTAQFQELADRLHAATKDIAYAGAFTIAGVDYDFWTLNQKLNFAAVDQDGDALVTGWEAIGAVQTNCEIDYETRITTVTFNSDQLQFLKVDIEAMKEELKIEAQQFNRDYGPRVTISFNGVESTFYANVIGSTDGGRSEGQSQAGGGIQGWGSFGGYPSGGSYPSGGGFPSAGGGGYPTGGGGTPSGSLPTFDMPAEQQQGQGLS